MKSKRVHLLRLKLTSWRRATSGWRGETRASRWKPTSMRLRPPAPTKRKNPSTSLKSSVCQWTLSLTTSPQKTKLARRSKARNQVQKEAGQSSVAKMRRMPQPRRITKAPSSERRAAKTRNASQGPKQLESVVQVENPRDPRARVAPRLLHRFTVRLSLLTCPVMSKKRRTISQMCTQLTGISDSLQMIVQRIPCPRGSPKEKVSQVLLMIGKREIQRTQVPWNLCWRVKRRSDEVALSTL